MAIGGDGSGGGTGGQVDVDNQSAIITHAWLEPDATGVDTIFQNMIESISSGRSRLSDAIDDADRELENLLKK